MDFTKNKTLPFDIYDFFGYMFPGFAMFAYLFFFLRNVFNDSEKLKMFYDFFKVPNPNYEILVTIIILTCGIMIVYILGHLVATIGSFWLDRVFLYGPFDTPVYFLLNIENSGRSKYLESSYRYIFIFFYLINLLSMLAFIPDLFGIGILFIFIFVLLIGLFVIMRICYEFPKCKKKFDVFKHSKLINFFVTGKLGGFLNVVYEFVRMLVNNNKRLPDEFIESYRVEFRKRFQSDYNLLGDENLWLSYFYIASKDAVHTSNIRTWHQLYGFSRNIACASYISAILCSLFLTTSYLFTYNNPNVGYIVIQLIISLIVGTIFYLRYFNLNQTYYTRNILRSFVVLSKLENNTKIEKNIIKENV